MTTIPLADMPEPRAARGEPVNKETVSYEGIEGTDAQSWAAVSGYPYLTNKVVFTCLKLDFDRSVPPIARRHVYLASLYNSRCHQCLWRGRGATLATVHHIILLLKDSGTW